MQTESDHYIASKLEVELVGTGHNQVIRQTISVPRTWTRSWKFERKEDWKRGKLLGEGGGGTVYLEECIEGESKDKQRAVKAVKRAKCDFRREIEAAMIFSHEKVDKAIVCTQKHG